MYDFLSLAAFLLGPLLLLACIVMLIISQWRRKRRKVIISAAILIGTLLSPLLIDTCAIRAALNGEARIMSRGLFGAYGFSLEQNVYAEGEPIELQGCTDNPFWFPMAGASNNTTFGAVVYDKNGNRFGLEPGQHCDVLVAEPNKFNLVAPYSCDPIDIPVVAHLPKGEYDLLPSDTKDKHECWSGPDRKPDEPSLHITIQ